MACGAGVFWALPGLSATGFDLLELLQDGLVLRVHRSFGSLYGRLSLRGIVAQAVPQNMGAILGSPTNINVCLSCLQKLL